MPYKDPERRRTYIRAYMRKRRARQRDEAEADKSKAIPKPEALQVLPDIEDSTATPKKPKVKVRYYKPQTPVWIYIALLTCLVIAGVALYLAIQAQEAVRYWFGG